MFHRGPNLGIVLELPTTFVVKCLITSETKDGNMARRMVLPLLLVTLLCARPCAAQSSTVGYWRFEEGSPGAVASGTGTILDSSGNGNNGTPENGPTYSTNVPTSTIPQTGASNHLSMLFNGTNQQIFIPDDPSLALTQSLTLEAYIDPLSVSSISGSPTDSQTIVFRGDTRDGYDPYKLDMNHGNLVFEINNASNDQVVVEVPFDAVNQWTEVAGTLNNATGVMDLYENGDLVATTTTSIRPFATLESDKDPGLGIGNVEAADNEYFDGYIDEVRISDQALSPSQFLSDVVPEPVSLGIVCGGFLVMLARPGRMRKSKED